MNYPALLTKIKEASLNKNWQEVLSSFNTLNKSGVQLTDPALFHPVLKACSATSFIHGKSLHASAIKLGVESTTSVANSIMDFYSKTGLIESTFNVFRSMKIKDSVSWNVMISGHVEYGDFEAGMLSFMQARAAAFEPNLSTLVIVIQGINKFGKLNEGCKIHGYMIKTNLVTVLAIRNSLLCMYANMAIEYAHKVFDEMSERDVVSWSTLISGYVKSDNADVGLTIFKRMLSQFNAGLDGQTVVIALKACVDLKNDITGRTLHGFVFRKGFLNDLFVGNSLIEIYSKFNDPDSAFQAWNDMRLKNIVSWNTILSGLVSNGKHFEAVNLFKSMQKSKTEPDAVTLVNLIQVCKHFANPNICESIHTMIIKNNHVLNHFIINTLIDVYAKCNLINSAQKLFNSIKIHDTVSWTTMIAAFAHCGLPDEAIKVFNNMMQTNEKPNVVTLLNLIEACSCYSELKRPKTVHGIAIRLGFATDTIVGTAILDMYSSYGDIVTSNKVFNQIIKQNVVSFSAMIAACGMNGIPHEALRLLTEMETHGLKPNSVTLLSVLSACSHGGLINEGISYFRKFIKSQQVNPTLEHYSCIVDLLSRGGKLDLAMELVDQMAKSQSVGASAWGALLSGCRTSHDINEDINEKVINRVIEFEPDKSSGYMLASNMYAARGSWDAAARFRAMARDKRVKVVAGYSMIHVRNTSYKFIAGDNNQIFLNEIRDTLEELHKCMKMERNYLC